MYRKCWSRRHTRDNGSSGTRRVLIVMITVLLICSVYYRVVRHDNLFNISFTDGSYQDPCVIPQLDPFDPDIMKNVKKLSPIRCDSYLQLLYVDNTNVIQFNSSVFYKNQKLNTSNITCECNTLVRVNGDNQVEFSSPTSCTPPVDFKSDFLKIKCFTGVSNLNNLIYENILTKIHKSSRKTFKPLSEGIYNVLMFGLDTVSRSTAIRQLPRTLEFLSNAGGFDFKGYMKVGDNTLPNLLALLTGLPELSPLLPKIDYAKDFWDDFPFLWKNFSENGYVTLFAEDLPFLTEFNNKMQGFRLEPTDHYQRPYWLGWHNLMPIRDNKGGFALELMDFEFFKGNVERHVFCVGDKPNHVAHLHYLKQFFSSYKTERKFVFSFLTELGHNNPNLLNIADADFVELFQWMEQNGHLNETVLVFFSDHGPKKSGIIVTELLERSLPVLNIVIPNSLRSKHPHIVENLRRNTMKLTTPFDLHVTLKDVSSMKFDSPSKAVVDAIKGTNAYSLFGSLSEKRSCADANIPESYCVCSKANQTTITNKTLEHHLATSIVEKINSFLSVNDECVPLKLNNVIKVLEVSQPIVPKTTSTRFVLRPKIWVEPDKKYEVFIETLPGGAHFRATCQIKSYKISVLNEIDRLNVYGNQSHCVRDHVMKTMCYCKGQSN